MLGESGGSGGGGTGPWGSTTPLESKKAFSETIDLKAEARGEKQNQETWTAWWHHPGVGWDRVRLKAMSQLGQTARDPLRQREKGHQLLSLSEDWTSTCSFMDN